MRDICYSDFIKGISKSRKAIQKLEGFVDKNFLLEKLKESPEKLEILEKIIHPMVRIREREILKDFFLRGEKIVFFDTPLLFEKKRRFFLIK